ncbi:hypothetical protein SAMN05444483_103250 [Salegentibacter echinorum]|uniref:Uncharacterized protein n=1 Tax=Salegentibacter echinorum TaxID=1073325 RepID=A0A1M5FLZ1_SALEC|nr:hypothetical protein SAMN05444483_103250 [Salegentibacter echinorum]
MQFYNNLKTNVLIMIYIYGESLINFKNINYESTKSSSNIL